MDWIGALSHQFHGKLLRDDEDIDAFAFSYLHNMSETDLLQLIENMNREEIVQMVHLYINKQLTEQLSQNL
ncbi:hypothetical protein J2S09_003557 [Bacillus fengqiuensis]|nr:hypothetical protein [Bacillus fengqiuensis]